MPDSTASNQDAPAVTSAVAPAITSGPRIKKLRHASSLQGLGGLVVAVTFFLPAVKGCSAPIVPVVEVYEAIGRGHSIDGWGVSAWILLPYLVGLNLAVSAVRRRRAEKTVSVPRDVATPVLMGIWVAVYGGLLIRDAEDWGSLAYWAQTEVLVFGACASLICFYLACGTCRREGWPLSIRWCALLLMLVWFGVWMVFNFSATYYGMWLSTAGTLAMLVGVVWEAAIRSILPWRSALWGLVRCKLELRELDQPFCERCGYWLIGLTSRRCPECGTAFESDETGVSMAP